MIESKMQIIDVNNINFEPIKHTYTDGDGKRLISVSTLVHTFVPPFDFDGKIKKRIAEREGVTEEEITQKWLKINKDSCDYGHKAHSEVEFYIKNKKIKKDGIYKNIVKEFKRIKFKGELQAEIRLSNLKYRIAGTTDLVEFVDKNVVNLYDLKTNKKIVQYCPFGNRMLPPFERYYSTNFFHYTMQLNLYAFLLEEAGWWVNNMTLLHVNPKDFKIKEYEIPFKRNDTLRMVEFAPELAKKL
jgi:hypothetical protein